LAWTNKKGSTLNVATLLWVKWEDETPAPKVGDLESSGTPECLEFNSRGQNTLHWGVLGVIGKVLKCRCPKFPRIGHLDICSPSYRQKKCRESNWQFDSRPLKVENRPLPNLRMESATRSWKDLDKGYNFGLAFVVIRLCSRELWARKVLGLQPGQFRDNFGTPTWESRENNHLDVAPVGSCREYYMGEGGGFPKSGPWWVLCVKVPVACPNTQRCSRMWTNPFVGCFGCRFKLDNLVPFSSLIPGLLARPSTSL
jgi:hypothetical protein